MAVVSSRYLPIHRVSDSSVIKRCFYINLPISVPTIAFTFIWVKAKPARAIAGSQYADKEELGESGEVKSKSWTSGFRKLGRLDWIGAGVVLGLTTCLVKLYNLVALMVISPRDSLGFNGEGTRVCLYIALLAEV
jgi:hypothetical protein